MQQVIVGLKLLTHNNKSHYSPGVFLQNINISRITLKLLIVDDKIHLSLGRYIA